MANVELKDFIAETLKGIALGVREAQQFSEKNDGVPIGLYAVGGEQTSAGEQLVKFSVSVRADVETSKTSSVEAKATIISVLSGKADASASNSTTGQTAHTIEFSVPMHFNSRWSKKDAK